MSAPRATAPSADVSFMDILTSEDCATRFRKPEIFLRCLRAGWLSPFVREHKTVLYAKPDVDACIARLRSEGLPPARNRKPAKAK